MKKMHLRNKEFWTFLESSHNFWTQMFSSYHAFSNHNISILVLVQKFERKGLLGSTSESISRILTSRSRFQKFLLLAFRSRSHFQFRKFDLLLLVLSFENLKIQSMILCYMLELKYKNTLLNKCLNYKKRKLKVRKFWFF